MHIAIIVDCYYPSAKSGAKLIHDLGTELRQQGHQVTIITPSEHVTENLKVTCEEGLQVARIRTGKLKGTAKIIRAYREANLSAHLWRAGKEFFRAQRCDLIVFYSPSIFFGALVAKLKGLWKCPAYLILRDIFPQWALDAGVLHKGLVYRFFCWKELEQYAAADVIGVQSPANLQYFARQRRQNYRLDVLYNWTTLEEPLATSDYRRQLGLQNKVVFFYGGNIGVAQDMDNILRLATSLRQEQQIHFLLVGEGSEVTRLKLLIAAGKLKNIQILPPVGQAEYLAMLSEFDIGLVSLDRRLRTQNFPGKILGYMSAAKPMLCSLNPGNDLKQMVEEHEAGLCCDNGDDERLYQHALALAGDAGLRARLGANARQLLKKNFAVAAIAGQILTHFTATPMVHYADLKQPALPVGATLKAS